jgi:hypothetical protein
MKGQKEHYANDPELIAWDVACNLAAERAGNSYYALQNASYLNPGRILQNMRILLDKMPSYEDQDFVVAVQEFPDVGTAKHRILLDELAARRLYHVRPEAKDSSVGFILSQGLHHGPPRYAHLGTDVKEILQAMGHTEEVDPKDLDSLRTTARKTYLIDLEASAKRPGLRLLCVHAKEFKTQAGTRLLAKYLRACVGSVQECSAVVMIDSNVPNLDMCNTFADGLQDQGFEVLSPAGGYFTTQKTRSEMHGQIYDNRKCLKTVKSHKDFLALLQTTKRWECQGMAHAHPNLKAEPQDLPNPQWPSDHCMLRIELLTPI